MTAPDLALACRMCEKAVRNHRTGLCNAHYLRLRRHGDAEGGRHPDRWVERFWSKVEKSDDCWLWKGSTLSGYGRFQVGGRTLGAHRLAYELTYGRKIVNQLDHLCRNPTCVRPDHLEDVTSRENTLRGISPSAMNARKSYCVNGHDIHAIARGQDGSRRCPQCRSLWSRQFEARRRRT